jgi:hypothetical protein
MRRPRIWLCLTPLGFAVLDAGLTLAGQGGRYWSGAYLHANEGNSVYRWLLQQHPSAFAAGILAWLALFSLAILAVPRRLAIAIAVAIVLGHTWGLATGLVANVPHGYWVALAMFLVAGYALALCLERYVQAEDLTRAA